MKNLKNYVDNISNNIDDKINKINSIEYHYELSSFIEDTEKLSSEEIEMIIETLLNKYLELVKPVFTKEKYKNIIRKVDEITEFFIESREQSVFFDCDIVAEDLMCKLVNDNNRVLNLPIKIKYLKEYCLTTLINEEDLNEALIWIILRIATTYYLLKENK